MNTKPNPEQPPYTKTNPPRVTVVDRKTGQKIHNPSFKMMEVTKKGDIKIR
jgi:hypothetical protein